MSNKIGLCKYCWEALCCQCQENLIDDDNDHVSKSELRKWCETYLKAIGHKQCNAYTIREATVIYDILERFCKGEK